MSAIRLAPEIEECLTRPAKRTGRTETFDARKAILEDLEDGLALERLEKLDRQRLAEYLLRAPFSRQKIHWNPRTRTVIYCSRRSSRTKRNFEVFKAIDFLAAAINHIPPCGHQTIRYYGLYSNKRRGMPRPSAAVTESAGEKQPAAKPPIVPPPPKVTARAMRPLWRDLILRVWDADPLQCPCCKSTMQVVDTLFRAGEIEFFLCLHGPPHSPTPVRVLTVSGAAGAKAISLQ
jgi:hypothetical protein